MPYPPQLRVLAAPVLRLTRPLFPTTGEIEAVVHGYRMILDCTDSMQRSIYMNAYERYDARRIEGLLRAGDTFVDVGANIGYYTALASRLVTPSGRVVAFEPSPYAFERLTRFVSDNKLLNIIPLNCALSDCQGTVTLYVPHAGSGHHDPSLYEYGQEMTAVQVEAEPLDSALARMDIDNATVIKIDVEGHELSVLRGARNYLGAGRIRHILCEVNTDMLRLAGTRVSEICSFLDGFGFRTREAQALRGEENVSQNWLFSRDA